MEPIQGLHHVTAVTRNAQVNVDFYRNVLGQRFVKKTVNFDVPDSYHFYFADEVGTPGTVLTFFVWPNMKRGIRGNGETAALAYNIPGGSIGFWQEHLQRWDVETLPIEMRFGAEVLSFDDPDGMRVELVESDSSPAVRHWDAGPIPQVHALNGFHSVTLWLDEVVSTAELLTDQMGYRFEGREESRHRFVGGPQALARVVNILHRPSRPEEIPAEADFGAGSIHHIAFRVPDDEAQIQYRSVLLGAGLDVTPVIDRKYFRSIYYREPGGVLFEIATEPPGFTVDEPLESLGEELKLPDWFEPHRAEIQKGLGPVTLKPIEKVRL